MPFLQDYSTQEVDRYINEIYVNKPPGDYLIPCRDLVEAVSLRNRINRLRQSERTRALREYRKDCEAHGKVFNERDCFLLYEQMVFRLSKGEPGVVMTISSGDLDALRADFERANAPGAQAQKAKPSLAPEVLKGAPKGAAPSDKDYTNIGF